MKQLNRFIFIKKILGPRAFIALNKLFRNFLKIEKMKNKKMFGKVRKKCLK
jgi:hypothetical protein